MAARKKTYPLVKAAEDYARRVVAGKIVACKWIKLACQRHLDDLERAKEDGFAYYFDPAKAEKVAKFLQLLPHTKGKWASNWAASSSASRSDSVITSRGAQRVISSHACSAAPVR